MKMSAFPSELCVKLFSLRITSFFFCEEDAFIVFTVVKDTAVHHFHGTVSVIGNFDIVGDHKQGLGLFPDSEVSSSKISIVVLESRLLVAHRRK